MYQFTDDWAQEIADESTRSEYQNATVSLIDPALVVSTYDIATGVTTTTDDGVVWIGQARIIDVRWGTNRENSDTLNADTNVSVRVQFPSDPDFSRSGVDGEYMVRRGMKLKVISSPRNRSLERRIMACTSDIQGSMAASRTVQFSTDVDSVIA